MIQIAEIDDTIKMALNKGFIAIFSKNDAIRAIE